MAFITPFRFDDAVILRKLFLSHLFGTAGFLGYFATGLGTALSRSVPCAGDLLLLLFLSAYTRYAWTLVEHCPVPMRRIALQDTFAESGPYLDLIDLYGLTARHIAAAVESVVLRKA